MITTRKLLAWLLMTALMLSGAVVANGAELEGEITFMVLDAMTKTNDAPLYAAVAAFEDLHPGTKVNVEPVPATDLKDKFTNSALAGAAPDVVSLDTGGWIVDAASIGVIQALDEQLDPIKDQFQPGALGAGLYNGKYYAVPWYLNNAGMFYNKTILAEAGVEAVPATWDEFNVAAEKITAAGYKVLCSSATPAYFMFMFYMQQGNFVLDTSVIPPVSTFNSETGKAAFEQFLNIQLKYNGIPESAKDALAWDQIVAPFVQEEAAFLFIGDWGNSMVSGGNPDLDYGIAPLPAGSQKATVMGGFSLCIAQSTSNFDLAWEFVSYLASYEQNDTMLGYGRIGARKDIDVEALVEKAPHLKVFIDQAPYSYARPSVKAIAQVQDIMDYAYQSVLLGVDDIDTALEAADAQLNELMAEKYE